MTGRPQNTGRLQAPLLVLGSFLDESVSGPEPLLSRVSAVTKDSPHQGKEEEAWEGTSGGLGAAATDLRPQRRLGVRWAACLDESTQLTESQAVPATSSLLGNTALQRGEETKTETNAMPSGTL